jgi:hypothetical protein
MSVTARPTTGLLVLDGDRLLAARHPADAAVREGREEPGVGVVLGGFVPGCICAATPLRFVFSTVDAAVRGVARRRQASAY